MLCLVPVADAPEETREEPKVKGEAHESCIDNVGKIGVVDPSLVSSRPQFVGGAVNKIVFFTGKSAADDRPLLDEAPSIAPGKDPPRSRFEVLYSEGLTPGTYYLRVIVINRDGNYAGEPTAVPFVIEG